jgi:tetratricopeptide (TPR) repeat protein
MFRFAIAALVLAVSSAPPALARQTPTARQQGEAIRHYRAGQDLLYRESFDKAAAEFRQAIQLDPLLTLAHYGLGQANMNLKQYPAAVRAFSDCRDAYRRIGELSLRRAVDGDRLRDDEIRELRDTIRAIRSGRVKMNQPENAILKLESRIGDLEVSKSKGLQTVPVPAEVFFSLGSAHFRAGQLDEAERGWKEAVSHNSGFGEAYNNLAALYLTTGRPREADGAVKQAEKAGFKVHPNLKADIRKALGGGRP